MKTIFAFLMSFILVSGCSGDKPVKPKPTRLNAPTDVVAVQAEGKKVTLTWTDTNDGKAGYAIYIINASNIDNPNLIHTTQAGVTTYTITEGLEYNVSYYFGVRAKAVIEEYDSAIAKTKTPIKLNNPDNPDGPDDPDDPVDPTTLESKIPDDMVLIYGGGRHRNPVNWSANYLKDYVIYTDKQGGKHWLFDGFLLLEFMDDGAGGTNRTYISGYKDWSNPLPSALKSDWERLANYYFEMFSGVNALEAAISDAISEMGKAPETKRKVYIGVPEPIKNQVWKNTSTATVYWGELNGKHLNFADEQDRFAACKWYIDKIIASFKQGNYKNIELAGFYWVAEKATNTRLLMPEVANYIKPKGYAFIWIPYYTADGFNDWKNFGFTTAYLQPNYFFNASTPVSRLADACNQAKMYDMAMEMEFDGNALESNGRGYKLRDYMNAFKEHGVWESLPITYYQGSWALRWLKGSSSQADQALYHDFCEFVVTRPYRTKE